MQNVSPQCKDLIKRMLMPDNRRPSFSQIFNHPWMKSDAPNVPLNLNFHKMSEFAKSCKLRKLTANFIASRLSDKEVEKLGNMFRAIDINKDGSISLEELKIALDSQKDEKCLQELKKLMQAIDTDKNGTINYTEFLASSSEVASMFNRENLQTVFKSIDKDGNGSVDRYELAEALQKSSLNSATKQEIESIVSSCDKDNDGKIDFEEFCSAMIGAN